MSDPKEYVAGSSSLVMGCDGYTSPAELGDTEYISGMNVVCRGGILQTRPGSRSLFCLPSGNFQGATLFTPDNGTAQLVAAVDGKIYVSAAPFTSYRRLANVQFSITSKYVAWAITLKSTDFDLEGNLITLDNPYSILIMQDGATRAAYWDGGTSGHLNPGYPADVTDVVPGFTETPIGLWMIWSGNRLWVSRGNQVFASDIGNPLKFTEGLYLNEGRAFYLSGPCTGMIELPSDSNGPKGFIAFTETNGTLFSSYIQDRTQWLNTPLFQNTIIPNVGCVAPRSLVTQYGLTWWFGPRGLANINSALRQNITSRIDYQDNEMFSSKAYLGPDLSGICGSFYENYLMMSVPSCDVLNRHTWVLDQAPMDGNANAWTGFWSGWRPVEWCRGIVNGSERVFFGSIDYDGSNRIWEAFIPEKTDNGCAITCYAQLRDHAAGNLDQKKYDWSKFFLSQLYGEVDLNIYVAATKGGYQLQKGYHLVASKGQIFSDVQYSEDGPFMIGNRFQSRTIRTPSGLDDNECNSCGVESKEGNKIDYAFSHLLVWSGQMGIRAYQMHMQESPERQAGDCEEDEIAPRTLNASGCSGLELLVDGQIFPVFTGHAEGVTKTSYGSDVYIRRTSNSSISQRNADAMAACAVEQIIAQLKDSGVAPGVYDSLAAEIGNGTYVVINSYTAPDAPPQPSIDSVSYESVFGNAVLCGFSEFLVSVPPKKFRKLVTSGQAWICVRIQNGTCTGLMNDVESFDFDNATVLQYDPDTCAVNSGVYHEYIITSPAAVCEFSTAGADFPNAVAQFSGGAATEPFPFGTITRTSTSFRWPFNGACVVGGDSLDRRFFGNQNQDLSVEDTEDDAIARDTPSGSGSSATSYREARGAGVFDFDWQESTAVLALINLVPNLTYNIRFDILTENYGGGSPVNSHSVYSFTASADSQVINIPIPVASGKQVTASNPTISLV